MEPLSFRTRIGLRAAQRGYALIEREQHRQERLEQMTSGQTGVLRLARRALASAFRNRSPRLLIATLVSLLAVGVVTPIRLARIWHASAKAIGWRLTFAAWWEISALRGLCLRSEVQYLLPPIMRLCTRREPITYQQEEG